MPNLPRLTDQDPRDAAAELRQAADAIRAAIKEVARPADRWAYRRTSSNPGHVAHVAAEGDPQWSGIADVIVGSGAEDHIAGADPTVMLAVADWLDLEAQMLPKRGHNSREGHTFHALTVARAYLRTVPAVPS